LGNLFTLMSKISIKKATFITAISKYTNVLLGFIFLAILARLLTPEDFGIVAIVTIFTSFFSLISNLGIGPAIIQDKTLTNEEINHIFSFSVYASVISVILFCLLGFPLALFFGNQEYIFICAILSLSLFFNVLNTVPNALLRKKGRFLLLGVRSIVVSIGTYAITIVLALMQFNHYALIVQSILSALFVFVWNLKNVKLHLSLKIDFMAIKKIKKYSSYQFGFNFINYLARNLDKFIIGRIWGASALAQYDRAYRFMLFPINNSTLVLSSVLHPILSKDQDNLEYIYYKYMQIVKILSLLGVFITAFCFWSSQEIIILVFGNQWYEAANYFRWLSLSLWAQMVTSSAGAIYQSIGNTKLMFTSGLVHVSISICAIIIGILLGNLNTFALCVSIGFIVKFFVEYFFLVKKGFQKKLTAFLYAFIFDMIVFIILFVGLFCFSLFLDIIDFPLLSSFFLKLIFTIALFFFCIFFTGQWKFLKKIMHNNRNYEKTI